MIKNKPLFTLLTFIFLISCKPVKFKKTNYYTRAVDPYGFFGTVSICDSTDNYYINDWHKDYKPDFGKYQDELGIIEPYVSIELDWKNNLFKNDIKTLKDIIRSKLMNEYGLNGHVKNGIDQLTMAESFNVINTNQIDNEKKIHNVKIPYNSLLYIEKPKNKLNIFLYLGVFTNDRVETFEGNLRTYIIDSQGKMVVYASRIGLGCDLRDLDHLNYVIDYSLNKIGLNKVN